MAAYTIKQSAGDFSTIASAMADAGTVSGDTFTIEGSWTVDDTAAVTVSDPNLTVTTDASSKVDPTDLASPSHYRLRHAGGSTCISIGDNNFNIDGVEINQASTTTAGAKGIRWNISGATSLLTVKNCVLWATVEYTQQDGIYYSLSGILNIENCILFGFGRAGLHLQNGSEVRTTIFNVNSCTSCKNTNSNFAARQNSTGSTITCNAFNSNLGSITDTGGDIGSTGTFETEITWDLHQCVVEDTSTSEDSGAVGCLTSRTLRDATAGGDEVLVQDITGSAPFDLTLIDDDTNNDAQEMHTAGSGAGMSMPTTDIMGNTRSSPYSCGAFHVVAAAAGISSPPKRHSLNYLLTR